MAAGEGTLEASMVKAYVCRAAEWVTREAMQLHGGMGYAEEFPVSRFFVDARVLSIFEGADETLCLRVIARRLAEQALSYEPARTPARRRRSALRGGRAACAARSGTNGASSSTIARVAACERREHVGPRASPRSVHGCARLDRAVHRVDLGDDRTGRGTQVERVDRVVDRARSRRDRAAPFAPRLRPAPPSPTRRCTRLPMPFARSRFAVSTRRVSVKSASPTRGTSRSSHQRTASTPNRATRSIGSTALPSDLPILRPFAVT